MTKWCCFRAPENTSPAPKGRPAIIRPAVPAVTPIPAPVPVSAVQSPGPSPAEIYLKIVRKNQQQQQQGSRRERPVQGLGEVLVDGVNRGVALVQEQGERLVGGVQRGVALVHGLVQGQGGGGGNNNNGGGGYIGQGLGAMMVGGAQRGVGLVQGLFEGQAAKDRRKVAQLHLRRNDHPDWGDKRHRPGVPQN